MLQGRLQCPISRTEKRIFADVRERNIFASIFFLALTLTVRERMFGNRILVWTGCEFSVTSVLTVLLLG